MSNLKTQTSSMKDKASSIQYLCSNIEDIYDKFNKINCNLESAIKCRQSIQELSNQCLHELNHIELSTDAYAKLLIDSAKAYDKSEESLFTMFDQLDFETLDTKNVSTNVPINTKNYFDSEESLSELTLDDTDFDSSEPFSKATFDNTDFGSLDSFSKSTLNNTVFDPLEPFSKATLDNIDFSSLKSTIKGKYSDEEIIALKKSMKDIFKDNKNVNIPVENEQGEIDAVIDKNFEDLVKYFLDSCRGNIPTYGGIDLFATYKSLPDNFKLMALMHWIDLIKENKPIDTTNVIPDEYFENIPPVPLTDSNLEKITSENKYESEAAFRYYERYFYPLEAMYEYQRGSEYSKVAYREWAKLVYGPSEKERNEEFVMGLIWGGISSMFSGFYDTIEGIYSVFTNYDQLGPFLKILASLPFSENNKILIFDMIKQSIEEWKTAYADADPSEKGFMIGQLIGETISFVLDAGGAIKSVTQLAKFIRSGGFKLALKKVIKMSKGIKHLMKMTFNDLADSVKKITKLSDGYKVVLDTGEVMKVPYEKLSKIDKSKFDSLVDYLKKADIQNYSLDEENDDENEGTGKSKINPLDNPKIAKDITTDPDAVYGYVPKEGSSLEQFDIDWTNPEEVAKARAARLEYLEAMDIKKSKISDEINKYLSEGKEMNDIAEIMVNKRNTDRIGSYLKRENSQGLEFLYERNLLQYGRKEGPSLDYLYNKYGSYEDVIYSSVKVNLGMNVLLGID